MKIILSCGFVFATWICVVLSFYEKRHLLKKHNLFCKISNADAADDDSDSSLIRINKCLPMLSRREADRVIDSGRITVNGNRAKVGDRVKLNDIVCMDGKIQQWQHLAEAKVRTLDIEEDTREFIYIKYWKPPGITCTCYDHDRTNIIRAGRFHTFPQRIFPVGRLDKDSTGLILLTSDGRINNALLKASQQREKVYEVQFTSRASDEQIKQLAEGVWIETMKQRDGGKQYGQVKTLPCQITRLSSPNHSFSTTVQITLVEGKNRQIRRMSEAIGLRVQTLHRISFHGITLNNLEKEGSWKDLSKEEMLLIKEALTS